MKHVLSYALFLLFLPFLPWIKRQARHVRKTAIRLPDAIDKEQATRLQRPYLLHIGESTVAGVGVKHANDAFTAQLIQRLEQRHQQSIDWQRHGITGITAHGLLTTLAQKKPLQQLISQQAPAVLIITLGVNDTTGMTSNRRWQQAVTTLAQDYADTKTHVVFTQIPPMHAFPALPKPLNWLLGLRAWQLDQQLRQLCQQHDWQYLAMGAALKPEWMAADGYHPNAQGYQHWAEDAAARLDWSPSATTNDRAVP